MAKQTNKNYPLKQLTNFFFFFLETSLISISKPYSYAFPLFPSCMQCLRFQCLIFIQSFSFLLSPPSLLGFFPLLLYFPLFKFSPVPSNYFTSSALFHYVTAFPCLVFLNAFLYPTPAALCSLPYHKTAPSRTRSCRTEPNHS